MVSLILAFILTFQICFTAKQDTINNNCIIHECSHGGIIRGDTAKKELAIVCTGGNYADGGEHIRKVLKSHKVKSSFFFTGDFYRNPDFESLIQGLRKDGHYLGAHSDQHLLYCDWENRDSLLVTREEFLSDLKANYEEMARFGVTPENARYFMPPYEWYNDSVSMWTYEAGFQLINFTPGTLSNADYTTPDKSNYRSNEVIMQSIVDFEKNSISGLNGFILLIHIGTAPERSDKFYHRLDDLITWLEKNDYELKRVDELLN